MKRQSGSPYKVLYWMGAALGLLLLAVLGLIIWMPRHAAVAPDPERTMLYLYDDTTGSVPPAVIVIEESRSRSGLVALPFAAPAELEKAYGGTSPRAAQDWVAAQLQRKIHHRVFLPYSIVSKLTDAAGGISLDGQTLKGSEAVDYIRAGSDQGARRAGLVMLALAEAASTRGVNMGLSEGLAMARKIDTDMDLTAIPDVLGRWSGYASPKVASPGRSDPATLGKLLLPDQ